MNLNEIKNLIEADGGKFIIIENEEPVLVLMNFNEYKKILENSKKEELKPELSSALEENPEKKEIEKEKIEITKVTDRIEDNEESVQKNETPKELEQGVTIEDLPF